MTAAFPHKYEVGLRWDGNGPATVAEPPRMPIVAGPPEEFGGQKEWWSPEHLLLSSLALCLQTTLQAIAAKARLPIGGFGCQAIGTLDKTHAGLAFTSLTLDVAVSVDEADGPRAEEILRTAKRHCLIANSLNVPVELKARVLVRQTVA
ncbi:MAG: OsmC family protein [Acidobacteriota bacterium]